MITNFNIRRVTNGWVVEMWDANQDDGPHHFGSATTQTAVFSRAEDMLEFMRQQTLPPG